MADIKHKLIQTLVVAIEAMVVIMRFPTLLLRPYAVAIENRLTLRVHAIQFLLEFSWNTHELTVGITPELRAEVVHFLKTTWHAGRACFDIKELEVLVGKLES